MVDTATNGKHSTPEKWSGLVRNCQIVHAAIQNWSADSFSRSNFMRGGPDLLDPRRNIAAECGWPHNPDIRLYSDLYNREGPATRSVNVYPDECWSVHPELYEKEGETKTLFEERWDDLVFRHNLWESLYRLDVLSGIGRFGVILLGLDDGKEFSSPVAGVTSDGSPRTNKAESDLLYVRVFDESLVMVSAREQDPRSARFGLPTLYTLQLDDGDSGQRDVQVHWHRMIHAADNLRSSMVYGTPRLEGVVNRIADLRKVLGGSAEMFWQGALPGFALETYPELATEDLDTDSVKEQVVNFVNGLQRWVAVNGMTVKSLAPQVADPTNHVEQQLRLICASIKVPMRVFLGSEQGQLASEQDMVLWNRRVRKRQETYVDPMLVRPFANRLIALGVLPPVNRFFLNWTDINSLSDKDRAEVSVKRAQALVQYVTGGVESVMSPLYFMTEVMGIPSPRAKAILAAQATNKTTKVWQKSKVTPGPQPSASGAGRQSPRNSQEPPLA